MMWLLQHANPGEGSDASARPSDAVEKAGKGQWKSISLVSQLERIVTVWTYEEYGGKQRRDEVWIELQDGGHLLCIVLLIIV